jgi:hypothetical protein
LNTAVLAAAGSSIVLGIGWLLISLTGFQFLWVAALYGGFVSGAVAHYSGGRGISYQLIATMFTILGIVFFDTVVIWLHWSEMARAAGSNAARPELLALMEHQFESDPFTGVFLVVGVMGGLWLWK